MPDAAQITVEAWRAMETAGMLRSVIVNGDTTIPIDFRNPYVDALGAATTNPVAFCLSADLPQAAQGDILEIAGEFYKVINIEPDEAELLRLHLQKADL